MMDNEKSDETLAESAENAEEISAEETTDESASEEPTAVSNEQADETVEETVDSPDDVPGNVVEEAPSDDGESTEEEREGVEASAEESLPELTLGEGAPQSAEAAEPVVAVKVRGKIDKFGVALGTGRRKTSVARVRITDGSGQLSINGRSLDDFFRLERDRRSVEAPLRATGNYGVVDVWVRVRGGGTTGQAGAISLGIARALQAKDPSLHVVLSESGYLTRDGRMVERKKYGYKKARKSFQFSKR